LARAARDLTSSELPVDIGRAQWSDQTMIAGARTFFGTGLWIWEISPFAGGTRAVAQTLLDTAGSQRCVVSGDSLHTGDTKFRSAVRANTPF